MTLDSFNAFTVTVTPQGVLWKYSIGHTYNIWPRREKTCLQEFAKNKEAYQSAHLRRLISAFIVRFMGGIISKLATSEISIFLLVSVAE